MNWTRLIKLMLPIRMRRGERLLALIEGLCGQTMTDAYIAERYKEREKEAARMLGQRMVVEEALKSRFGHEVQMYGQEDGAVMLFGDVNAEPPYRMICTGSKDRNKAVLITDVEGADVGCDFRVEVPEGVDLKAVEKFLDGLVLAGVGYRVEYRNENEN